MARKGKQKQFGKPRARKEIINSTHLAALKKIQDAIGRSDLTTAYQRALIFTQQYASNPHGWEMLASVQARQQDLKSACGSIQKAIELSKDNPPVLELKLAQYEFFNGDEHQCIKRLNALGERIPLEKRVWVWLSRAYHVVGLNKEALIANEKAYELDRHYPDTLVWRSRIFDQLKRHSEAYEASVTLKKLKPNMVGVSNHLASLSLREGDYEAAEQHFKDELAIGENVSAVYNSFIAKHYDPRFSAEELAEIANQFEGLYIKEVNAQRAITEKRKGKRLRLGLLSGSFRTHPVGQMILPALTSVDKNEVEFFFYTTNHIVDNLTLEIKKVADSWVSVTGLSDDQLNQKIRNDHIDILIDMNGGGEGSRFMALTKEPAPLIVKWVGILINTTGLKCFDYLLSDSIETPRNVDHLYAEKLIRMPDDYVCYHLPKYIPEVTSLPALKNRFVTFGCLNNPAKLSRELIKEWSALMHEVPNSKLLLRGIQFEGEAFCRRIITRFAEFGISEKRLLLEGPAQHKEFLGTYQRIDIALDTWPYSGGLTTCEALAMGVPVVTCMGPTFAGRHSATHLANAGLPELVTDNWDDFRKRAKELASDLPNLAVIRAALRTILKESPVCDGARFAKNFTKAMRAIWQRHCDGKAPEALTFNKESDIWFADEVEPVALVEVESVSDLGEADFEWNLMNPVMVMDNGARFASHARFAEWMQTGNFAVITFDPGSLLTNDADRLKQLGEWHHYPHATLGDGQDATLYVTLNSECTGTLEPLDDKHGFTRDDSLRVLSELPISTVSLDDIKGIPTVDFIALDGFNSISKIVTGGADALSNVLVVQVRVYFDKTHKGQASIGILEELFEKLGFSFHCMKSVEFDEGYCGDDGNVVVSGSRYISADAVFLPNKKRIDSMEKSRKEKLAYILHSVFEIDDVSLNLCEKSGFFYRYLSFIKKKNEYLNVVPGSHERCEAFIGDDDNLFFIL